MKKKQYSLVGLFIVTLLFNIAFIFNVNVFADTLSTNYQPVIDNVNKTADSVELQWHVSDDDYYYFNIYRATSKDGDYQLLSQSYFPYYTDYNFSAGVHYFYKIETVYFDENDDLTVCKAYGKIPKKYLNAKDYNCPHFDNENNGWYQLIKDKVERQQKKEK